jgi:hypothetical protein
MGSTSTKSTVVSGLPYYVWEVPGKAISIQLFFDVIDRMSPDILRGFGALKRRGAEVGGILLGRSEPGPPLKIVIEDFEPVPSEYLTGPSYNLSPNDLAEFEAALARRAGSDSGITPVGFYRSHTRDDLFLDDTDLALASRYFPGPENVFLLIKPFASRPCVGGFFFWEDGEINRESSYLQFPFQRKELGGGETPAPAAPPANSYSGLPPLPPYTPLDEPRELLPVEPSEPLRQMVVERHSPSILHGFPEPRPSTRPALRRLLVPLFLAMAAIGGFFAYSSLNSPKPAAHPASVDTALPLKLSVTEKQTQLEVTWDRNSPAITQARRGVLSILDGANRRELELSGAQLRNGRVLYSRLSGDVNLRLEVFSDGQGSVNESIRIVSTDAPQPVAVPASAPRPAEPPPPMKKTIAKRAAPRETRRPAATPRAPEAAIRPPALQPLVAPPAPADVELQRPKSRR